MLAVERRASICHRIEGKGSKGRRWVSILIGCSDSLSLGEALMGDDSDAGR